MELYVTHLQTESVSIAMFWYYLQVSVVSILHSWLANELAVLATGLLGVEEVRQLKLDSWHIMQSYLLESRLILKLFVGTSVCFTSLSNVSGSVETHESLVSDFIVVTGERERGKQKPTVFNVVWLV